MSFSSDVKNELYKQIDGARDCQLAELAAIINSCGEFKAVPETPKALVLKLDKQALYRKCFTLLKKTYNINFVSSEGYVSEAQNSEVCEIVITDEKRIDDILRGIKIIDADGNFKGFGHKADNTLLKSQWCRQAYIRGIFLCCGSVNDPNKSYHLEIVCGQEDRANQIVQILTTFEIDAKINCRKNRFVVYIKEGNSIVDFLGICGAHVSVMSLESLRVLKSVGNDVNRRNNCDIANIKKTAAAYNRLVEDITLIQRVYGFEKLPDSLKEIAEIRLEYPEATLQELGQLLDPPVGKSGVNHRLRKLSELAETLR